MIKILIELKFTLFVRQPYVFGKRKYQLGINRDEIISVNRAATLAIVYIAAL